MKTKLFFTSLFIGLSFTLLANDKKTIQSKLNEVTVFFQGAELIHTTTTSLLKGETEVEISGLSPVVDKNSIKIKTTNGVLVSAFEFSVDYLSKRNLTADSTEIKKIADAIEEHEQQKAILETSYKVNSDLLEILRSSVEKNVEGSEVGLSIDDLVKTMDYFATKSLELEEQLRSDKKKVEWIDREIYKLNAQLQQVARTNDKMSGILKLNLATNAATNSTITISYFTRNAKWTPYYDVNVASTDKPVRITSKAKVSQSTGLDWDKVKLSLSTSAPGSGKTAPLFSTWFLSYYQPPVIAKYTGPHVALAMQNSYSYNAKAMKVSEIAFAGDGYDEVVEEQTMDDYVVQTENQLNITFNIDIPYSIPGNGKELNIELKNQEVPATFKYYSAPKLNTDTYVLAEISDWQKLNLLNATANITYDGTYVGESFIDAYSTQENLTLTLGSDKRVPVKREKQQDYSSTKFLGNDTKQVFSYKLTVRNNQNTTIKMVLKDQYPKSTLKEIEVEFLSKETTTPTHNIEDLGVVTWEFDMKPGETKVFNFAYSVKYPKGKRLNL